MTKEKDPACVEEYKQRLRDKARICDNLFNSTGSPHYHDTEWHRDCLQNARQEYDNFLSACANLTSDSQPLLKSEGHIEQGGWGLIYNGEKEKCCNVKFTRRIGVDDEIFAIVVYSNGQIVAELAEGNSTDVCGRNIKVHGYASSGAVTGYWVASAIHDFKLK